MDKEQIGIPKLRFPGFTGAWKQRKLGEVAEIKTGSRNHQDSVDNGKYPFFVRSEKVERLNEYDFDTKAILVPGDGRIGEIFHYYDGKFALHQRVYKVDNFKEVNPLYLLNLFKYKFKKHALRLNAQGTVPSLRLPMFTNWNILIPNLNEQQKIGLFFQQLDSLIALHQRKLEHLKQQKNGLLQKMFPKNGESVPEVRFPGFTDSWEQRKLGEVVNIFSGWSPSNFKEGDFGSDIFIKVDDLNHSTREQLNSQMNVLESQKYKKIPKGSTIFPKRGAAIMTNKVRILGKSAYMDTNMMALEASDISSEFLYTFITKTGLFKIADTSTIPQINNKHINPYPIKLPTMPEQKQIGKFFKQVDSLIALHQRKLEHLELLKKGLLQQMFV